MRHVAGGKVTSAHSTATEEAERVVKVAVTFPEVTKIVLGVIKPGLRSGQLRLKFLPITGGLRVEVRGISSVQQVFVYTSDAAQTEVDLRKLFN